MILPSEIAEDEEKEEVEEFFVKRRKVVDAEAQKVVEGFIHRGSQMIVYTLLEQAGKTTCNL